MTLISDLTSDQLAEHASNTFVLKGRTEEGGRLVYRALQLNPKHPIAMRCLSDLFSIHPTEPLSAVVLEYALSSECNLNHEDRKIIDDLRFFNIWSLGFSIHKSGNPTLGYAEFQTRSDFTIRQSEYDKFIEGILSTTGGSLGDTYRTILNICACQADALQHKIKVRSDIGFTDSIDQTNFIETNGYKKWLSGNTKKLDNLKKEFESLKVKPLSDESKKSWWKRLLKI